MVGGEVARALIDLHTNHVPLKFMPIEDATFAMWAMAMDLRYVHHPKFHISPECCFKQQERCGRTTRCGRRRLRAASLHRCKALTVHVLCLCRAMPRRKEGDEGVQQLQLADHVAQGLCGPDPWLVLHKVVAPDEMRYIGASVANCSSTEPWVLPDSIQAHVSQATRKFYFDQRIAWLRSQKTG